jgi:hypothetical protein
VRRSPVEAVLTAVVGTLRGSTGLTGLISSTGIYNNVDQGAALPYAVVSSPTDRRMDTIGQLGSEVLVNVLVASQARGDKEAAQILDQAIRALNFSVLPTTQHDTFGCAWENSERYSDTINGVTTRYHVGIFRVWTGQSAA